MSARAKQSAAVKAPARAKQSAAVKAPARRKAPAPARPRYRTIEVEVHDAIALVALARPEVHNAFDETLIAELHRAFIALGADERVRAVVLAGHGPSFCAGADVHWMRRMARAGTKANFADAQALAAMLAALDTMGKPTIARVHGAALGGGVGLVACCDIAIAAHDASFGLSEARLGLIPATVGPYVIGAIGARQARRYFLTAERFTASEAFRIGLVHDLVPPAELGPRVNEILGALFAAGPRAQAEAKRLIRDLAGRPVDAALIADTAARIATLRASAEAREGIAAFLERRDAAWIPPALRRR